MCLQVRRKESCERLMEKDVFSLEIYGGFDPALIMSWVVFVDHINSENLRLLTKAALYCRIRSYRLLNMNDKKREGISVANGDDVKEASPPDKTFQHQQTDERIISG